MAVGIGRRGGRALVLADGRREAIVDDAGALLYDGVPQLASAWRRDPLPVLVARLVLLLAPPELDGRRLVVT